MTGVTLSRDLNCGCGARLHMIRFPGERFHLRPKLRNGCPGRKGYCAALRPGPRYSLDHDPVFFCPARQRSRNCDLSPSLLLGRDRQRFDSDAIQTADPRLEDFGADWLWLRASRPKRLEPVSSLSGCLGGGLHRLTLFNLRRAYEAFLEKLASARG